MKWFIGALLLLLAALLLESSLLAYAMYVLLGLLLLSRWLARSWIGSLSATRTCKQLTAEIGDRVSVHLSVTNNGGLPIPWLLAEDLLPQYSLGSRFPRIKIKGKRLQIAMLRGGAALEMKYTIECLMRGYFQVGPLTLESGDLFGLHRRFRVLTEPTFLLVYPRIVQLLGYDIASRRPIGDVRLTHRLYEDPTRIAGVRPYEAGDPLNRVHWRATARTGALHSKIHEPSTLSGATVLLDFHQAGYHQQGEPFRSELAVTTAVSMANAVYEMGQQIGLATNGRDAVDRIKTEGWQHDPRTRQAARATAAMREENERLQPLLVETRRGVEQLQRIRETLARVELTDGLNFAELVSESIVRLPRDATILAVLPEVAVETAIALGTLRRAGLAVAVVLILLDDEPLERAYGRLVAEGIRDIRHLKSEEELPELCRRQVDRSSPYSFLT
ncbi:MAG: DUF58 domain-containing protein [Gemmataceae bacterium]